jgi:uncharacterized protein
VSVLLKRWWWVLLTVAVLGGLYRLRFDVDILDLLPPDEPTVQGLKLYQRHFTNARELVVTLRAPDGEQAERLVGALGARLRQETNLVADVMWQAPWMEDPAQMAELLGVIWLNQPPSEFSALANRLAPDHLQTVLDQTKEELRTSMSPMDVARRAFDPYNLLDLPALANFSSISMGQGSQSFASADGTFRLLFVQSAVDLGGYQECERWLKSMWASVDDLRTGPSAADWKDVTVRFTGRPVFVAEIARSMQRDISGSVIGTSLIIAVLFWLTHRRWLPMLWLLALLGLVLLATLAIGGLVLGTISVVSMGFAAVLLGLAVDYAVVHYQEALAHPQLSVPEIRRAIAPSILWAAITTISAFLVLNLGGLPGLGQLGTLVALGVALAALVMVMIYLPPLFPGRRVPPVWHVPPPWWSFFVAPKPSKTEKAEPRGAPSKAALVTTGVIVAAAATMLCFKRPDLDKTGNALRPQHSEAEAALMELTSEVTGESKGTAEPYWLLVSGNQEQDVSHNLEAAESLLDTAVSNRWIKGYLLPSVIWPHADYQAANRATAAKLGRMGPTLRDAALRAGFKTNALVLTEELVRTWARAAGTTNLVWPTNQVSQWLLKRFVAHTPDQWLAMGLIYPAANAVAPATLAGLSSELAAKHALLSSWELLGSTTLQRVRGTMWQVVTPMILLVLASLWFAFRRPLEILLGMAVLLMSGLFLLALMAAAGWSWNLLNLMGAPLILGTGVDYTLFMQLALRRHNGDLVTVRRSVGRALLLCGGTAMAGFGSLAWSSNPGMASLGKVCAVGIGANMLISVFLLPAWWLWFQGRRGGPGINPESESPGGLPQPRTAAPSFYRARLWLFGLFIVRVVPAGLLKWVAGNVAELYCQIRRQQRELVARNLLPALSGDEAAARNAARRLHRNFAMKLIDLWRLENGLEVRDWLKRDGELEIFRSARERGCGVLFITLHLGNWEHGGILLNQLGIPLMILTQPEPDDGLTELRIASRRRCGVESLVIGQGDFAFVEVIKHLQSGATLALSLDRPPARRGVPVKFFGQPFVAPAAAAELARASGCALIGVIILRRPNGYEVRVLPEFKYDRRALGQREARQELTQQILRAFEPHIREDIDQWYQFVPIWPNDV